MISIIIPSRGRPNELATSLNSLRLAKNGLEALVWLDTDDPKLAQYQTSFQSNPHVTLFIKERVGYKNAHVMFNFLCSKAKYDWIFEFNDDAYMTNPDWFSIFKDFVKVFEPTVQPVVINIWGQGTDIANLFPIVSRKLVELLGHFSLATACDDYIRYVGMNAQISYDLKGIKPKHRKYTGGDILIDQTYRDIEKDRAESAGTWHLRRSPARGHLKDDIKKIIAYNKSTEPCQNCLCIKTIGFIGLGKLGLPVAQAIADRGYRVIGYDIKPIETSLPLADSIKDLVKKSDIVFCAVQTPHDPLYEGDKPLPQSRVDFDYSYLTRAVKDVAAVGKKITLVVISTCLPGTFETVIKPLLTSHITYLYNPLFIAMGTVVQDFLNPEFVLIGGDNPTILKHFYTKILGQDKTFITDITTAEGIKVFYNTFVTTKTVLANMYGEFAHKMGMHVNHIYEVLAKATDRLVSARYLKSGVADGGPCHPRDNIALSFLARKIGLSFDYFDALMTAREKHMAWLADMFIEQIKTTGLPGILLGKSFKPETAIQTGSAAMLLATLLKNKKVPFAHYEFDYPKKLPVGVYFLATQHETYKTLPYPTGSRIIDPFRYIPQRNGITIIAIGR